MSSTPNSEVSSTAHPSRVSRVCAFVGFRKSSVEPSLDVQQITGHQLPPPPTTYTTHQELVNSDLVSDFFGAGKPVFSGPPPYTPYGHKVVETQASVCTVEEPRTLARMLFLYGFLFFPFWLVGISILFVPLVPTEDWEGGKNEEEKAMLLRIHRDTEKKWACRCLVAMSGLSVAVILLVIIVKYGIMASI